MPEKPERLEVINQLNKTINRFILLSRKFIDTSAFPYGLADKLRGFNFQEILLTYDFEYFAFTKSAKSLIAIRELLRKGLNEDAIILVRSMFENYLSCRYYNENENLSKDFIDNPIGVALAFYNVNQTGEVIDRQDNIIGKIENPSKFKVGKDRDYFYFFYDFLSRFAHCNFAIHNCYIDKGIYYTVDKRNNEILVRLFTVFVFSKLFEHVVTVEGEEFYTLDFEKKCYEMVIDSQKQLDAVFLLLINEVSKSQSELRKYENKRLKRMFKEMRKSLKEEVGSIKKSN